MIVRSHCGSNSAVQMNFEKMFWAMVLASLTAIFVCGILLGGWLMMRFSTTSVHDTGARIEDRTYKIQEIAAVSRRRTSRINNHEDSTSVDDKEKTQSLADAEARIEDLTNKIEELTAESRRCNTEIKNHEVLHIAGTGTRFHVNANCPGLNRAEPASKRKLTPCQHCAAPLQGQFSMTGSYRSAA
jgi:flagellar biosynthesis GTPase FlhF